MDSLLWTKKISFIVMPVAVIVDNATIQRKTRWCAAPVTVIVPVIIKIKEAINAVQTVLALVGSAVTLPMLFCLITKEYTSTVASARVTVKVAVAIRTRVVEDVSQPQQDSLLKMGNQ